MKDAMLTLNAVSGGESLVKAQRIKKKVQRDDAEGWYEPEKIEAPSLQLTKESIKVGLAILRKTYGIKLASYLCGLDSETQFRKWEKGTEEPNYYQNRSIRNAIEVTEILLSKVSPKVAVEWMTQPCEYLLYWLPMDELRADATMVRNAALTLLI
jgi:hypothetical protein